MTDNFINLDLKGRNKFYSYLNQFNLTGENTGKRCGIDVIITDKNQCKYGVEIKNRSNKAENYPTLFIEADKYQSLLNHNAKQHFKQSYYVNFVGNKMYIYDLYTLNKEISDKGWVKRWMNEKTAESTTKKIQKWVCELPKETAIKYIYVENKWKKQQ